MERYQRNIGTLTLAENESLRTKKVAVTGCGGLGGYVLEMLGRIGIGHLTAIDGDVFEISNLNRQVLTHTKNIGSSKALEACKRLELVNPEVSVFPVACRIRKENALDLLHGHDAIVDAMDNVPDRLVLADACASLGIPLVHGAIAGWYGQVATILPGEGTMDKLFHNSLGQKGPDLGNPSFTPALVAAVQAAEVIKILLGRGELLSGDKVLFIDCLNHEYSCVRL